MTYGKEDLRVTEDCYSLAFDSKTNQMCQLWYKTQGGFYYLRVAERLTWPPCLPMMPSVTWNRDPFTLLPERYWPLVMDFVMECEP